MRGGERSTWWPEGRDDWGRPTGGRQDDFALSPYGDEKYAHEFDAYDAPGGGHHRRYSRGDPGPMKRVTNRESNMEPPSKRPIELDMYF
jgi:hypothetical protein